MAKAKRVEGGPVAPRGFRAAGVFCDIKQLGTGKGSDKGAKRDLALLVSDTPCTVAGMFTTNQICAAPVKLCVARMRSGCARAVVANSGNANACTGPRGMKDAETMARLAGEALGVTPAEVLVASTGRIGVALPMGNIAKGIAAAALDLGDDPAHAGFAVEAIMTSDTRPKQLAVEFLLGGKKVRLGGMCKGAGMIHPGMSADGKRPAQGLHATMLAFLTTDATVAHGPLQKALSQAVAKSFNRVTVDGDMSTNDTVLLLANGLAGNAPVRSASGADYAAFCRALDEVCAALAGMIARDGEGVHRVVTVRVHGARTAADADAAARAIANSALVKTSWHGGDPNWGRILCAAGYSAAKVVEEKVDIGYSAPGSGRIVYSLKKGRPTSTSFARLCEAVAPAEFDLHVFLNLGTYGTAIVAADLTEDYVDFNKGDVTDPASLGG